LGDFNANDYEFIKYIFTGHNVNENFDCPFLKIRRLLKNNRFEDFILLETKTFGKIVFEIFGRYYVNDQNEEIYEFIFNDITRVKMEEEINAELKYKSLLLSKVAHEFKNPILCITELVDQICEKKEHIRHPFVYKNLKNIKSMSDYLIILIKDMDFFSLKNNTTNTLVAVKDFVNIDILLRFCKNITKILIKKFHKESVNIVIEKQYHFNKIYTDEIKLKQILVNLISNSVKFTNSGTITLRVEEIDKSLVFSVIDTGKGISELKFSTLFKPYTESNHEHNTLGSGLGLSIVRDLVILLESKITCKTEKNKGTTFTFSLKIDDNSDVSINNDLNSPISNKTIKLSPFKNISKEEIDKLFNKDIVKSHTNILTINEEFFKEFEENEKYIAVVDDEVITRKSTIRVINSYCAEKKIKLRVLEANDGIELLYCYYSLYKRGKMLSIVISDQSMILMNGSVSAKIINELSINRELMHTPIYILTAYESFNLTKDYGINGVLTKPITKSVIKDIFEKVGLFDQL
jgi:signal transduction histidine kinase/CheY-like chemotaxis protein